MTVIPYDGVRPMRYALFLVGALSLGLVACSKNPEPEVTPNPEAPPPPPPGPTPTPPPPPPMTEGPTCEQVITNMVNELAVMIHFDTDKYDIRPGADADALDRKAVVLKSHPAVRVRITGHADERHTDEYNLVLGTRRAEAGKDYLVRQGVEARRIETASLGETQPIDPGHDESAWSKNRRDEFLVLSGRETLASHLSRCQ